MYVRCPLVNARERVQGKTSALFSMTTFSPFYTCVRWLFIYWLFGTAILNLGMNWWALIRLIRLLVTVIVLWR